MKRAVWRKRSCDRAAIVGSPGTCWWFSSQKLRLNFQDLSRSSGRSVMIGSLLFSLSSLPAVWIALVALLSSTGPRARAIYFAICGANAVSVATSLSVVREATAKADLFRDTQFLSLLLLKFNAFIKAPRELQHSLQTRRSVCVGSVPTFNSVYHTSGANFQLCRAEAGCPSASVTL